MLLAGAGADRRIDEKWRRQCRICRSGARLPLRTFYRQLRTAGYSYRGLLAHTRHTLARQYLADPALAQTDVALLLGYSEQSSFIRAFRSWTGTTPGAYRAGLARKGKDASGRDHGE
ncbi:helix-turn-helix transcriptional regulator [Alkalilimnicola ehrlichii]|uniref:helix-turn-helix transcriptional regulator n=1 Tax=Alkalilimnicola ehrlichii TaxID=351052 RepID=UPI00384FE4E6